MTEWNRVESVLFEDDTTILTVFDGTEIVSVEILSTHAAVTAESCAVALGFGTLLEDC